MHIVTLWTIVMFAAHLTLSSFDRAAKRGSAQRWAALWIGFSWNGLDLSLFGETYKWPEQALRQGDPAPVDIVLGSLLIFIVLEATRRTIGWVLPIIHSVRPRLN